ncbi:GntR family transcriptional regulator [Cohnella nanjingensis]|uniref:GntR family transcriptional regulator n=1 Tax=Cohnella nanjingensis TaxID=1387779 RepID=A0A7X0RR92_9BACL|nr:GntR family transcriptional regulator [Cohnella nanjingensis]MBB6670789.1 GntR family transcriptional regulator [Cohnella nanjingensis]
MLKKLPTDPFARTQHTKDVIHKLRMDILLGVFEPDSYLVENQLAQDLGVSRGPIRTALQNLEQEGLVKSLPNGRTIVTGFSVKAAEDIFDLRLMLEKRALELIIANEMVDYFPILSVVDQIREINNANKIEDLTATFSTVDIQFHRSIMIMSENQAILQAWNLMANTLYAVLTISNNTFYTDFFEYFKTHKALSDLIIQRNPAVIQTITDHINDAKELVIKKLKDRLKS